jgi:acyl dehydratase
MPHELLGEAVCAHVSPVPGVELEAHRLAQFCRDHLEDHLVPFSFVIHDELPRMPNGKIDRSALVDGKAKETGTTAPSNSPGVTSVHQHQFALLLKQSRQLIGRRAIDVPPGVTVADWLNISRFVEATGDGNPLYLDARYGSHSWWRTLVAPPAFVLGIQVPEAAGALQERDYDAVDILSAVELWWNDHIRLGDRVAADLRVFEVNNGPAWRGRDTVEITSRVTYQSEGRCIAGGSGLVRIHPLRLGSELFVERAIHSYTPSEIERIEDSLAQEPAPRGASPRFYSEVSVGDPLPQIVRGPFTWSEMITWIVAEGRSWPAGNIRYRELVGQPGNIRAHAATGWPASDRKLAREDLLTCADVGFSAPCARPAFIVALVAQLITTWMGDDAVLRKLSTSLHQPVLYGDTLWLTGQVTGKSIQEISEQQYFAVTVEVRIVNQLEQQVTRATAVIFLPERGRPLQLPIFQEQP